MSKSRKPWPKLKTHDEVDAFIAEADLSEYDWGQPKPVSHEFEDKSARVTMRMSESQLARIKAEAERRGMKYQKFMRVLMERGMQNLGPR